MSPKLPALIAAELDSIDSDTDRARRCVDLLRAMVESFPEGWDCNGYRGALLNAASDLEDDANTMDARMREAEREDDYHERMAMLRRMGVMA